MDFLDQAFKASQDGKIEEWVNSFLNSDYDKNKGLSEGLKKSKRFWVGPIEVDLKNVPRIVGPEAHMEYPVEESGWRGKIENMARDIRQGWKPAPLIAEYRPEGLSLRDGNHRREALEAAGLKRYWTVIWFNSETDKEAFLSTNKPKNMRKYLIVFGALVVMLAGAAVAQTMHENSLLKTFASYRAAEYAIDGKTVTLGTNGTKYFGNEAVGDLNGDNIPDVAFLFTSQPGGSGTFYYVAGAIASIDRSGKTVYTGTNAVLIGDRIAPQATMIQDRGVLVSYATRRDDEPMTTKPYLMVSSFYQIRDGKLVYKGSR